MLTFQFDVEKIVLSVFDWNKIFDIAFIEADDNTNVVTNEGAILFNLNNDVQTVVFSQSKNIEIVFSKMSEDAKTVNIKVDDNVEILNNGTFYTLKSGNSIVNFNVYDANVSILEDNIISIDIVSSDARMSLEIPNPIFDNVNIMATNVPQAKILYSVEVDQKMPEFAINFYDDSNFTIPRPLYDNKPVMSLYSSNPADSEYNSTPISRRIYILVTCDTLIEPYLSSGQVSPNVTLIVYRNSPILSEGEIVPLYYYGPKTYGTNFYLDRTRADGELVFDINCNMTVKSALPISMSTKGEWTILQQNTEYETFSAKKDEQVEIQSVETETPKKKTRAKKKSKKTKE